MATGHEELYVIYLRSEFTWACPPEGLERPLVACATYSEARHLQRLLSKADVECIIRYHGDTGGGD